jgi:hypothetical protein
MSDLDDIERAIRERWLARVEWDGNGKRAEWSCLVCGKYDRHRTDASDYCPIAFVLDLLAATTAPAAEPCEACERTAEGCWRHRDPAALQDPA